MSELGTKILRCPNGSLLSVLAMLVTVRLAVLSGSMFLLACGSSQAPVVAKPSPAPAPTATASESPAPPSVLPAPPVSEKASADAPRATERGASFTVPAGWTLKSDGSRRVLESPEPGLSVVIVDATDSNVDTAVASAFAYVHPNSKRPLKIAQDLPARDGWEQRRSYTYETSPNERIVVYAIARRKGNAWTVMFVDGSEPAFERRFAQIRLVDQSLRPQGYSRESFRGKTAAPLDEKRVQAITSFLDEARTRAGVPGIAVSLIEKGRVIFEGGFGVRELGKPAQVDADTLFLIASNTKALSTLLLAKLIEEGKFTWETPVSSIFPTFRLGDDETTRQVLLKHLVCACTGLPRQDYEWFLEFKNATPKSEMQLLGTMQPTTKFGEIFQYSNVLASAAGYVAAQVAYPNRELGAAYDDAMRTRVFEPLAMKSTTFDFARALAKDHASGHAEDIDGKPALVSMNVNRAVIPLRPAGGAWSNVRDIARYVQMELASGALPDGKSFISKETLLARRAPQVAVGEDETYGMGLTVGTKYGIPVVHHGGSLFGFKSDMFWLPEQGVGGVILTNADSGGSLLRPFVRRVLEAMFDGQPEAAEDAESAAKTRKESIAKERERLVIPPDPAVRAGLAKRYANDALGEVVISARDRSTIFDFGEWKSAVASRKNDDGSISLLTIDPSVDGLEFVVANRDGKRAFLVRDMQHEYVFLEK